MPKAIKRRYSTQPLLKFLPVIKADAGKVIGRSANTIAAWHNQEHFLSENQADIIAITIGLHPVDIWPNWFDEDPLT